MPKSTKKLQALAANKNTPITTRFFLSLALNQEGAGHGNNVAVLKDTIQELEDAFNLNEDNEYGTLFIDKGERLLDGYDNFLPLIFLLSKASPYRYLLDPCSIPYDITAKMMSLINFCYQARLLTIEDFQPGSPYIPEEAKFFGKTNIEDFLMDGIPYKDTVSEAILFLPKEEQFARDVMFRRLIASEALFSPIALSLGNRDKEDCNIAYEDAVVKAELEGSILPKIAQMKKKVREQIALIPSNIEKKWTF